MLANLESLLAIKEAELEEARHQAAMWREMAAMPERWQGGRVQAWLKMEEKDRQMYLDIADRSFAMFLQIRKEYEAAANKEQTKPDMYTRRSMPKRTRKRNR